MWPSLAKCARGPSLHPNRLSGAAFAYYDDVDCTLVLVYSSL
jgi:hypothetical protein